MTLNASIGCSTLECANWKSKDKAEQIQLSSQNEVNEGSNDNCQWKSKLGGLWSQKKRRVHKDHFKEWSKKQLILESSQHCLLPTQRTPLNVQRTRKSRVWKTGHEGRIEKGSPQEWLAPRAMRTAEEVETHWTILRIPSSPFKETREGVEEAWQLEHCQKQARPSTNGYKNNALL